jgi:hypothetical protein
MTSKACRVCNQTFPLEQFCSNSRCKGGRANRCKMCYNSAKKKQVQCELCQAFVRKDGLLSHQSASICQNRQKPYFKFPVTGKAGKEIVKCPCKHWMCKRYIPSSQAYRHLKYNDGLFQGTRAEYIVHLTEELGDAKRAKKRAYRYAPRIRPDDFSGDKSSM